MGRQLPYAPGPFRAGQLVFGKSAVRSADRSRTMIKSIFSDRQTARERLIELLAGESHYDQGFCQHGVKPNDRIEPSRV